MTYLQETVRVVRANLRVQAKGESSESQSARERRALSQRLDALRSRHAKLRADADAVQGEVNQLVVALADDVSIAPSPHYLIHPCVLYVESFFT